jgi:two-component system, chemotaxis family, CheB/CheR fusion protein
MNDHRCAHGGAFHMLLANRPIMTGKLVEETLRENAQRLVRLIDTVPQLIWTASDEGQLCYCNADLRALIGHSSSLCIEDTVGSLIHAEDRQRWIAAWRAAFDHRQPYEIEYRLRPDEEGTWRWYLERGAPRAGESVERWFITATRIDEQKRREEELRSQLHRKDQFLATLLHELRNPLAPIENAIQLLARRADDPASVSGARGIIQRQLRQISRLVDDLNDVSRITRGGMAVRKQALDLSEVVTAAIETARPLIELRRHELTSSTPSTPVIVQGDAVRLGQVVTNLLINAAKYTNPGGHVSVIVERAADAAVVRVRDNGIGISHELLPRVFDLFAQAAPGSEATMGGIGVGLAVARELVELHDGSISVSSEGPGRGSEFIMRLPLPSGASA